MTIPASWPHGHVAASPGLSPDSHTSSLGPLLDLGPIEADELYAAMDWLGARQERIETRLAQRHLADGALVLWDLTSVWMEGRQCDLAAYGYSRDGKTGKRPIEFGLLCDREGRPVAVEVCDGHTSDPASVHSRSSCPGPLWPDPGGHRRGSGHVARGADPGRH